MTKKLIHQKPIWIVIDILGAIGVILSSTGLITNSYSTFTLGQLLIVSTGVALLLS